MSAPGHSHHHHHEHHRGSSANLRDFVLGLSDGLTVPFALAAGLSGAVNTTSLIVIAGVAEIVAGAISMGLSGYLATRTEKDYYAAEEQREHHEIKTVPHMEAEEVADILRDFGVPEAQVPIVVEAISQHPEKWVDFMMRFELGLEKPDPRRIWLSPIIIGGAYALGGMVPLIPYMLIHNVPEALRCSIGVSIIALLGFGAFKGRATGQNMIKAALQTMLIGAAAAAAAYVLAKWVAS